MILVLDTSGEQVYVGLWDKAKKSWLESRNFNGGRELNAVILKHLANLGIFKKNGNLSGVIVCAGPGSFTGLRIGISIANTLAYAADIPIVAPKETKGPENLLQKGLSMLESAGSSFGGAVVPHYGAEPHVTTPKS